MKKTTPKKPRIVLIVTAPNAGQTLEEWDKFFKTLGFRFEEGMTPESWERKQRVLTEHDR